MSIRIKILAAAVAAALSVTPAFAEILNFTWDYAPGEVATWSQPSNPTPISSEDNFDTDVAVSDGASNDGPFVHVLYYSNVATNGGLEIVGISFSDRGFQIYTGPESAPIFSPGRFIVGPTGDQLVIVTVAVPEPSTWAMLLIGFAGLGYARGFGGRALFAQSRAKTNEPQIPVRRRSAARAISA